MISAGANSTVQFAKAMQLSNYSAGVLTGGSWSVSAGSAMIFGEGAITTDAATILLTGVGATFESGTGYTFSSLQQSLTNIAANGSLILNQFAYATSNAIALNGLLSFGLSGSSFSSGLITASASSFITSASGTISSSLVDSGNIAVGGLESLTFTGASEIFTGAISGNGILAFTNGAHASLNLGAELSIREISLSGVGTALNINENVRDRGALDEASGAILTIASGDSLTLGGVSTLSGTVSGAGGLGLDGGTLTLNGKNTFTGAITFDAHAVSKLVLSAHALPTNAIAGLASGDTIDLTGLAYAAGDHIVFTLNASHSGGTLSIENTAGTVLESLRIAGDYNAAHFSLASDSAGGMLITTIGAGARAPDDFNGDGASDLLWANAVSGQIEDWLIANGALSKSHVLGALLPSSANRSSARAISTATEPPIC